jgi:hypothetical protein
VLFEIDASGFKIQPTDSMSSVHRKQFTQHQIAEMRVGDSGSGNQSILIWPRVRERRKSRDECSEEKSNQKRSDESTDSRAPVKCIPRAVYD